MNRDIEKEYLANHLLRKLKGFGDAPETEKPFRIQRKERLYIQGDAVVNIEHERDRKCQEFEFQIK